MEYGKMIHNFVDVADLAEQLAEQLAETIYLDSFETPYEGLEFSEEEIKESLRKEQQDAH